MADLTPSAQLVLDHLLTSTDRAGEAAEIIGAAAAALGMLVGFKVAADITYSVADRLATHGPAHG